MATVASCGSTAHVCDSTDRRPQIDPLGERTTYQYNSRNFLESIANPLNERTT